jgi:hypothetical protein
VAQELNTCRAKCTNSAFAALQNARGFRVKVLTNNLRGALLKPHHRIGHAERIEQTYRQKKRNPAKDRHDAVLNAQAFPVCNLEIQAQNTAEKRKNAEDIERQYQVFGAIYSYYRRMVYAGEDEHSPSDQRGSSTSRGAIRLRFEYR